MPTHATQQWMSFMKRLPFRGRLAGYYYSWQMRTCFIHTDWFHEPRRLWYSPSGSNLKATEWKWMITLQQLQSQRGSSPHVSLHEIWENAWLFEFCWWHITAPTRTFDWVMATSTNDVIHPSHAASIPQLQLRISILDSESGLQHTLPHTASEIETMGPHAAFYIWWFECLLCLGHRHAAHWVVSTHDVMVTVSSCTPNT